MQPSSDANVAAGYHGRQVRLNLWILVALTVMGAVRVELAWPTPSRWPLVVLGAATVVLVGGAKLRWERILRRDGVRRGLPGGYAAAILSLFVFNLWDPDALAIFPAGAMLVVVAASAQFRPRTIVGLGLLAVAGHLTLAAVVTPVAPVLAVSMSMVLTAASILCALTAHNRRRQSDQRAAAERRAGTLLENGSDAVVVVGDGQIRFASKSIGRILGYDAQDFTVDTLMSMTHPDDMAETSAWVTSLRSAPPGHTMRRESRCRHADGRWITVEVTGANRLHDPDLNAVVLTIRDVSAQKALEGELSRQAFEDALTGLPNRSLLAHRINQAVALRRHAGGRLALLLIDLDDFKQVNDTLGHAAGDDLIRTTAARMQSCVRPADTLARLGGDEFAVLVEDLDDPQLVALAERLLAAIRVPLRVGNRDLVTTASIGIASATSAEADTQELLRDADLAMYAAKTAGRDRYAVFDESMYADTLQEAEARVQLELALTNDEFVLHYQPIVDLPSGKLIGVEALVRWQHPERGLLGPNHFIGLAEKTGLIAPLGHWILKTACEQAATWHRERSGADPLRMSINLSARQFQHSNLVDDVAEILQSSGVNPSSIVLEITESLLMHDIEATADTLGRLRTLGVHIAIDDFGTGYSSLSYLRRFPVDILKIDKAFIDGITTDPDDATLAEAVVQLGRALRLQTVAEGIEQPDQHSLLTELGCTYGQGYLYAQPVPPDQIEPLFNQTNVRDSAVTGHT